jgi:hypothetical protein
MPLVIFHHLLNVSVQLANKRGFKKVIVLPWRCLLSVRCLLTGVYVRILLTEQFAFLVSEINPLSSMLPSLLCGHGWKQYVHDNGRRVLTSGTFLKKLFPLS